MRRVAVIGAGPVGIAAALGAIRRGHETTVLEARDVGASLRTWGATRFFTPLSMNITPEMRAAAVLPLDDALLTGSEYAEQVLLPIAESAILRNRVRTNTRVVRITRRGLTRTDYAGHPLRAEKPFRILTDADDIVECDVILDATGNTTTPLPYAARGESNVCAARTLGEVAATNFRGKRVALVGHGHSAANALLALQAAGADITWVVRTAKQRPCEEIANDPLPERQRVASAANDLASHIRVERRAMVESVVVAGSGRAEARPHISPGPRSSSNPEHFSPGPHPSRESWSERNVGTGFSPSRVCLTLTGDRKLEADAVIALTGYRPSSEFTAELPLEISNVNEGGARLYRAISNITDCLTAPRVTADDLTSGEPNYFFIGSRAYGRSRTFLLQTGFQQLETILDSIS